MDGQDMMEYQECNASPARVRKLWHYEGVGLRNECARPRFWVLAVCFIVAATIYGYAFIGPRGRIEPGRIGQHMTDFTVFTEAGAAFFDGRNPYRVTNPRGWHYLYPPLFALFVAPLSFFDTETQVVFWYAVNVTLTIACAGEARRLWRLLAARREPSRSRWIAVCAALAGILTFLDCMQAGQLGIAILYLLTVGFRRVMEQRSWHGGFLAGMVLALPAVIKLVPALPVVCLIAQLWSAVIFAYKTARPWRGPARSPQEWRRVYFASFWRSLRRLSVGRRTSTTCMSGEPASSRISASVRLRVSIFGAYATRALQTPSSSLKGRPLRAIGAGPQAPKEAKRPDRMVHPAVRVVIGVALTILLAVSFALGRRKSLLDQATAYSLAICATLVVSPLAWGHYYMALAPAVLCVPLWISSRGKPRLACCPAPKSPICGRATMTSR